MDASGSAIRSFKPFGLLSIVIVSLFNYNSDISMGNISRNLQMPWIQIEFQSCRWLRRKQKGCTSIPNFSREFSFSFAVIFVLFLITNKTMWRARITLSSSILQRSIWKQFLTIQTNKPYAFAFLYKMGFSINFMLRRWTCFHFGWKIIVSLAFFMF